MSSRKLLVVFGATGKQGSGVLTTLLSNPTLLTKYTLRGITRDTSTPKSQSLSSTGIQMVQADLNDPPSISHALTSAYGVFAMTDFWSHMSKATEIAHGKIIVDACVAAGVQHLVWSSLPDVTRLSAGKYTGVEHFDGKAEVERYAEGVKGGKMWVTYFLPAMFMDTLVTLPRRDGEGNLSLVMPWGDGDLPVPLFAARDAGGFVVGIWERGGEADGVEVQAVSEWVTPKRIMEAMGKGTGKKASLDYVDGDTYKSFLPEAIREDMGQMTLWIGEQSYYGLGAEKNQEKSNAFLLPGTKLTSLEDFVANGM